MVGLRFGSRPRRAALTPTPTGGWFWRAPREGETEPAAVARPGRFSRLRPPEGEDA